MRTYFENKGYLKQNKENGEEEKGNESGWCNKYQ